jgi:hypothetical protein
VFTGPLFSKILTLKTMPRSPIMPLNTTWWSRGIKKMQIPLSGYLHFFHDEASEVLFQVGITV